MGRKVHPIGFRVGVTKSRLSEWFSNKKAENAKFIVTDIRLRTFVEKFFDRCGVSKIVVKQTTKDFEIVIFTAKVSVVTGKDNEKITQLTQKIKKMFNVDCIVTVKAIKTPELSAKIMAEYICSQIESRTPFRKVAKATLQKIMEKNPMGAKIKVCGRLGGVDIARMESYSEGRVPLQTIRIDMDYCDTVAKTKYGIIGVKVRIAKSELFVKKNKEIVDKDILSL